MLPSTIKHDATINMKNLDPSSKSEIYKMLYSLKNKFNFELDIDASITAEVSEYRQAIAA